MKPLRGWRSRQSRRDIGVPGAREALDTEIRESGQVVGSKCNSSAEMKVGLDPWFGIKDIGGIIASQVKMAV